MAALPLVEDLVAANPDDNEIQVWLAHCLLSKSRTSGTPEEIPALRKRALEAAERARKKGNNSALLQNVLLVLNDPSTAQSLLGQCGSRRQNERGRSGFWAWR